MSIIGSGVKTGDVSDIISSTSGWATYTDTQYTLASPLTVAANTVTKLPNNGLSKIESQMPSDVTAFYDASTQKILGRNGDGLGLSIFFIAVPSAANQSIDAYIDITGGTGTPAFLSELYKQTFPFPKGAGVGRGILFDVTAAYTLIRGKLMVVIFMSSHLHHLMFMALFLTLLEHIRQVND